MKLIDWVAVLGALAWAPHLIALVKAWLQKSEIRVILQKTAELGFTTYGSIFNVRMAFAVENKDIVISEIKIRMKHESGEERILEWQGITQHIGKMKMPDASEMPYEKEHSVLAIKLNQKDIEERFVRFQEPSYLNNQREYVYKALKKMEYLKSENKYRGEDFLRELEMKELYAFNKHAFSWKQGKYTVQIEVQSPEKFVLVGNRFEFQLTPVDIERLEKNKDQLEADYKRIVLNVPEKDSDVIWEWCNPMLIKLNN